MLVHSDEVRGVQFAVVFTVNTHAFTVVGFPRLLESLGKSWIFSLKFQDLESPRKSLWSWKVLEKYS